MKISGKISDNSYLTKWGEILGEIDNQTDLIERLSAIESSCNDSVVAETSKRQSEDNLLSQAITKESDERQESHNRLSSMLLNEINRATEAEQTEVDERKTAVREVRDEIGPKADAAVVVANEAINTVNDHVVNEFVHIQDGERDFWNGKQDVVSAGANVVIDNNEISAIIPLLTSQLINSGEFGEMDSEGKFINKYIDNKEFLEELSYKVEINDLIRHLKDEYTSPEVPVPVYHVTKEEKDTWTSRLSEEGAKELFKVLQEAYNSDSEGVEGWTDTFISKIEQNEQGKIVVKREKVVAHVAGDYADLTNKPKVNGVELIGDLSSAELGIATKVSELENDLGFIDSHVTDLDNFYNKDFINNNYYTKDEFNKEEVYNVLDIKQNKLELDSEGTGAISLDNSTNIIKVKYDNDTITVNHENELVANIKVNDVKVDNVSVVDASGIANIDLSHKQNKLTAGANIDITSEGVISASGTISTSFAAITGYPDDNTELANKFNNYMSKAETKQVAKTGSYNDLTNKPTIDGAVITSLLTSAANPYSSTNRLATMGDVSSATGGGVVDVKVLNKSIVNTSKTAVINIPTTDMPGVIYLAGHNGVKVENGLISTIAATTAEIDNKTNANSIIAPSNLNYAVKKALTNPDTDPSSAAYWLYADKANARLTINAAPNEPAYYDGSSNPTVGLVSIPKFKGLVLGVGSSDRGQVTADVAASVDLASKTAYKLIDAANFGEALQNISYTTAEQDLVRTKLNAASATAKATSSDLGLVKVTGDDGIYIDTNGVIYADQANGTEIINRESTATKLITTAIYDEAVKDALCYSVSPTHDWSAVEQTSARTKLKAMEKFAVGNGLALVDDTTVVEGKTLSASVDGTSIGIDALGRLCVVGGSSGTGITNVKINGTSIVVSNEANIVTNGTYNASSNKIATMSDVPYSHKIYIGTDGIFPLGATAGDILFTYDASGNVTSTKVKM